MSAFVVEDKTINSILAWIEQCAWSSEKDHLIRPFRSIGYNINRAEIDDVFYGVLRKLASDLFKMNCDGVNARYGENQAQEFRPLDFEYKSITAPPIVQAIKSMQCLLYQCSEGDVGTQPLYKALADTIDRCCSHVVSALPEYDKAKWGS